MRLFMIAFLAATLLAGMGPAPAGAAGVDPPWEAVPQNGKSFHLPGVNDISDLHGDIADPQLVIFFAGNQFMVTPDLIAAFQKEYPQYERIYWETLPPGIEADQIREGALIVGTLRIAHRPDIFTRGRNALERMQKEEGRFGRMVDYAKNRLAIMVPQGNPKNVKGLMDLGRDDVMVSMPNPQWEGIGRVILKACEKAGGKELADRIMVKKKEDGATFLTHMHHRQTPMRIIMGESDAGPTWYTEPFFQKMIGNPVDMVEIPAEQNQIVTYTAAALKDAPHPKAAGDFLDFLAGPRAREVYMKYGFLPPD